MGLGGGTGTGELDFREGFYRDSRNRLVYATISGEGYARIVHIDFATEPTRRGLKSQSFQRFCSSHTYVENTQKFISEKRMELDAEIEFIARHSQKR